MGRIRKGAVKYIDGKLYARVRYTDTYGNRREKVKRAKNIVEANKLIKQIIRELDEGDLNSLNRKTMTFSDLADYYEKTHMIPAIYVDGHKIDGLRSLHTHKYAIKVFRAFFGTKNLKTITYGEVNRFRLERFRTKTIRGTQRTIATVNRELQVLRNMFNVAIREDWLSKNPFSGGKPLILKSFENQRERILSVEEEGKLLGLCTGRRKHLKSILILALDTGMRRGEIITLTFGDLDFENRLIHIKAHHTKTEKKRTLAMTSRVYQELIALYLNGSKNSGDSVFGISCDVKTSFKNICRQVGIEGLRFHDLRHTFASRLIGANVPGEIVSKLLGHTNITTTARYINTDVHTARYAASQIDIVNSI